jgi:hypothetical protein
MYKYDYKLFARHSITLNKFSVQLNIESDFTLIICRRFFCEVFFLLKFHAHTIISFIFTLSIHQTNLQANEMKQKKTLQFIFTQKLNCVMKNEVIVLVYSRGSSLSIL